jgi:magnesium transporter
MDSRTSILDDMLMEKLEKAFHKPTSMVLVHDVAKIASEYEPIDLAYACTRLPPNARHVVYDNLPDLHAKVIFMINTDSATRAAIFRAIDDREIKRLIDHMPTDEAVWLFDDLSDRRLRRVLELLDAKKAARIRELLRHDRNSAARLMTSEFFSFRMDVTIGEVAKAIRDNPGIDLTRRIFVLSDLGQLIGYVPARNIIVNPHELPLRQVMRPVLHKVEPDTSRDEVVDLVERYKIPALPVVNSDGIMLGVITYEVVVEAMEDIGDETIATIAGTAEAYSENEPILRRVFSRAPWLVVTFCSGLVTATALTHFSGRIWFLGVVPFFVPLINGMSGNVGLQCSTLLVRAMSTGELSAGIKHRAVMKELLIGLTIGFGFGFLAWSTVFVLNLAGLAALAYNPLTIGATLGAGVFSACLTATSLGVFFPFFFARMGIDPAVASGPLVTAFNDLCSTLMFLLIAFLVHGFFAY